MPSWHVPPPAQTHIPDNAGGAGRTMPAVFWKSYRIGIRLPGTFGIRRFCCWVSHTSFRSEFHSHSASAPADAEVMSPIDTGDVTAKNPAIVCSCTHSDPHVFISW